MLCHELGRDGDALGPIDFPEVMGDVALLFLGRLDVDPNRVMLIAANDRFDFTADSRREQENLAIGRRLVQQAAHGGKEAHVGHAIRLIEYDGRDVVQHDVAAFDEVLEASRAGDDDVDPLVEGPDLVAVAGSSKDRDHPLAVASQERTQHGMHLGGQLTSRYEDESPRATWSRLGHVGRDRHAKGKRLARTGRRLAADVAAGESGGNCGSLNGKWAGDAQLRQARVDVRGNAKVSKGSNDETPVE